MKNRLFVLIILIGYTGHAQIVNIPDANFKNALVNSNCVDTNGDGTFNADADTNDDGEIQESEAEAILRLYVKEKNIDSLEGIQYFINIEYLNCSYNNLIALNLTGAPNLVTLYAEQMDITNLDLSVNQDLARLDIWNNNLTNLDVSQNPNLHTLKCSWNQLTSLDVTQNPNLRVLICNYMELSELDTSQNPNLEYLGCTDNPMAIVDVTNNPNLTALECQSMGVPGLSSLDVSQNPNLYYLVCRFNDIDQLDLSQNPNLEVLQIDRNDLTSIDLSQNPLLDFFSCSEMQLTEIDVSQNPLLRYIKFDRNELFNIDLSQNPLLEYIIGTDNSLRNCNIQNGNNTILYDLKITGNPNLNCIQVDDENYANSQTCSSLGWCKDPTASYSELCDLVGIEDFSQTHFQLYPNPTGNVLNIQSKTPVENVMIYSFQGVLVKEVIANSVDVSNLSSGLYFVTLTLEGKEITKKFIKK